MRALAIDYGSKHIGLALGDTESRIATPWSVLDNEGILPVLARIHDIVQRDRVETIVLGIPHPLRNASLENDQIKSIRLFREHLAGLGIPIVEQDETLTSQLAARQATEGGHTGRLDDLAAAAILQTWLDKQAAS